MPLNAESILSLRASLKGDILQPGDDGYDSSLKRWSKLSERRAGLVAYPKDVEDVVSVVNFSTRNHVELVVKTSGHNQASSSSTDGGIVLDLSRYLNDVHVDTERRIARVGGGTIWEKVDEVCDGFGLSTVGSTMNQVSELLVAKASINVTLSFILGGGYGHLTSEHGLGVDNLAAATMVLADGSIVTASPTSNPDLFWGIRGAGGNFGICIALDLILHPQPSTIYAGELIFPPPKVDVVFDLAQKWQKEVQTSKDTLNLIFAVGPNGPGVVCSVFHNGPVDVGKKQFWRFQALGKLFLQIPADAPGPVVDKTGPSTYPSVNSRANSLQPAGRNVYTKAATHSSLPGHIADAMFKRFVAAGTKYPELKPSSVIFQFFHPGKINQPVDMAQNTRGTHGNIVINVAWEGDAGLLTEAKGAAAAIVSELGEYGEGAVAYGNSESDSGEGDRVTRLFGEKYPKLQELKARYDPDCVFGGWFPIEPKAS